MKLAIIVGSTRPNRVGPAIAQWVLDILKLDQALPHGNFSIIDLASFPLPAFNEPTHPMMVKDFSQFSNSVTRKWNEEIAAYDAYILISPEYHSGVPGTLKNAIDCLYHAWTGKPAMIITYGIFGGMQANSQLRQILGSGCHLEISSSCPRLEFPGRDEAKHNTSPALFQAMAGTISAETFSTWSHAEEEIRAGCRELVQMREA